MEGRSVVRQAHYMDLRLFVRKAGRQIRLPHSKRRRVSNLRGRESGRARSREKLLRLSTFNPYRKPTQVVRSRRPRRTSECSSRNSAKKRPYVSNKALPPSVPVNILLRLLQAL